VIGVARPALAVALGLTVVGVGYRVDRPAEGATALGPGEVTVKIDIEHSRFLPDELEVREGTLVRFVLHNGDPIRHEFVLGPADVHARHATGTEATHPPVPGEVSLEPGETAETIYLFEEAGHLEYVCHLPKHAEFGMTGAVHVAASSR
jgi:uncharacterized cupredoxin-like copper-binding protein